MTKKTLFLSVSLIAWALLLSSCASEGAGQPCPPKSDTQVIADTISDILVPKIRIGC